MPVWVMVVGASGSRCALSVCRAVCRWSLVAACGMRAAVGVVCGWWWVGGLPLSAVPCCGGGGGVAGEGVHELGACLAVAVGVFPAAWAVAAAACPVDGVAEVEFLSGEHGLAAAWAGAAVGVGEFGCPLAVVVAEVALGGGESVGFAWHRVTSGVWAWPKRLIRRSVTRSLFRLFR